MKTAAIDADFEELAQPAFKYYIHGAGLRGATESIIPGALSISKGAVPDLAPGLGHMAPTYVVGSRDRALRRPSRLRTSFFGSISALDLGLESLRMSLIQPAVPESLLAAKSEIRRRILTVRDALSVELRAAAAETIAHRGLPIDLPKGAIVSGFMPIRSEVNPLPLMRRCANAGAQLALPAITKRGLPLIMRAWSIGDPLVSGRWKIREPSVDAPEVTPDIVLAPLAAFDRRGNRLGYGAGYYDRTIQAARARKTVIAIGLAFAAQELDAVPVTDSDQPLDFVLTEAEMIDCGRA